MGGISRKVGQVCGVQAWGRPRPSRGGAEHALVFRKGKRIDRCLNADAGQNTIGTLLVQLPSTFTGGEISIFNNEGEDDEEGEKEDDIVFNMGATSGAPFSCHFVCHYNDCEYDFSKILSGSRMILRYSLRYRNGQAKPTAKLLNDSMSSLRWALEALPPADRMVLIPFAKDYKESSLVKHGINVLSNRHRSYVEAIRAAAEQGWKLLLVNAELNHSRKTGYYGNLMSSSSASSIVQIFDEEGNDVTAEEKWLKDAVDFDSAVGNVVGVEGMLLANDEDQTDDSWGCAISTKSSSSYYGNNTVKKTYKSTFLLAFDASLSDVELQCLSGCEGVAEVTDKIVAGRDYDLLERLLAVVETKEKSKFNLPSCQKLLQLLTRSRKPLSGNRLYFVNEILSGLSSTFEPTVEIYDAILAAVQKFGHVNCEAGISELLNDDTRARKVDLSIFLRRADFILKLTKRNQIGSSYLEKSITDLSSFGARKVQNSSLINSSINSMIAQHGAEAMKTVVQATLNFLHSRFSSNKWVGALLNRALLLWKMEDHQYDFLSACFTDFAVDFTKSLVQNGYAPRSSLQGENQRAFVKATLYLMQNGTDADLGRLGAWAASSEELLSLFMEAIVEQSNGLGADPHNLLRDIFNKCMVQNKTTISGWYSHRREDRTVVPSLHVRKILKDHPDLVRRIDSDGRITLHYAVGSSSTSYEAIMDVFEAFPQGASITDPVTGLSPFMLAASNNNIAASHSLLLANPSLVIGGVDVGGGKKRKRSQSF